MICFPSLETLRNFPEYMKRSECQMCVISEKDNQFCDLGKTVCVFFANFAASEVRCRTAPCNSGQSQKNDNI